MFERLSECAEELFKREIQLCEFNEDQKAAIFAEKTAENFGRSKRDHNEFGSEVVAMGDCAIRLLKMLPPKKEEIGGRTTNHSFPYTKARLCQFLCNAFDHTQKEEKYLEFAFELMLMSSQRFQTEEERKKTLDAMREHFKTEEYHYRVKKFMYVLRHTASQSENPAFKEMFHFVVRYGKKEDFKELIKFHEQNTQENSQTVSV